MKKVLTMVSAMILAGSALAGNVPGKYNGKLSLDFSGIKQALKNKAAKDPKMKDQLPMQLSALDNASKALANSVIVLELKKDGTLTMAQSMNGKSETETGKWTVKGNMITLSNLTGKNGGPKQLIGTISKDGKTLFFDLKEELKKQSAKQPGMPVPTGNLTFKRA